MSRLAYRQAVACFLETATKVQAEQWDTPALGVWNVRDLVAHQRSDGTWDEDLFTGTGWWSFTPICGWGVVLAVHYFYVRAANVDDDWVRERTEDLRIRSYDLGHITDLEERVRRGDRSVRPASERKGQSN